MSEPHPTSEKRSIRIQTPDGAVDGLLLTGPGQRTIDDLNVRAKRFVMLHSPENAPGAWQLGSGPLAVNKSSIVFVRELGPPPLLSTGRYGAFTRAAVRLRVAEFEIDGFVHVPAGGAPLKRLEHDGHDFLSLTSALVAGPTADETLPFVAVHRRFIRTAQILAGDGSEPSSALAGTASAG